MGVYPAPVLERTQGAATRFVATMQHGAAMQPRRRVASGTP
jgi:hypothetical protein